MIHSRLREIRKAKGLTLEQVAARVPPNGTTAQTIGRLETGMRNLTVDWIRRIATALDVDPASLLALPESGDLLVDGEVDESGRIRPGEQGVLSLRLSQDNPLCVRLGATIGQYRRGDRLIFQPFSKTDYSRAVGLDCLVEDSDATRYFAKVAPGSQANQFTLLPIGNQGPIIEDVSPTLIAPVTHLVRPLA